MSKAEQKFDVSSGTAANSISVPLKTEVELRAIAAARETAEAHAREAEAARRKADSESGFAFNAKKNSEEHASAIAQLKGQVEADSAWLLSTKKNAEEGAQAIGSVRATAEAEGKAISEARATAKRDTGRIDSLRDAAESSTEVIQKAESESAKAHSEATASAAATAAARLAAETAAAAIQSAQSAAIASAAATAASANEAAAKAKSAEDATKDFEQLLTELRSADAKAAEYREQLASLGAAFSETVKKIEGLLPGAASAGLASAFRDQKLRSAGSMKLWMGAFTLSLAVMLLTGGLLLDVSDTWDGILRHVVQRLPVVLPLIWFAIYAGRNFMLAQRLREDYAYKETLSAAFEGYKRQMADVGSSSDGPSPLVTLCNNVLQTLGQRPGRLYEGKPEDITPLAPIVRAVEPVAEAVKATAGKVA